MQPLSPHPTSWVRICILTRSLERHVYTLKLGSVAFGDTFSRAKAPCWVQCVRGAWF